MRPDTSRRLYLTNSALHVSRRHLLAGLVALPALTLANRGLAAETKILVIGAGISGLTAAQELRSSGCEVKVLEARGRIGGRIATDRSAGFPIERGANWVHGLHGNPLTDLANRAGVRLVVSDDDRLALRGADGRLVPQGRIEAGYEHLEQLSKRIDAQFGPENDLSLQRALDGLGDKDLPKGAASAVERWLLQFVIDADSAASPDQLSAAFHDEGAYFEGSDAIPAGGYDLLLKPLTNGLEILLNHEVTEIVHGQAGCTVIASGETFSADAVISTLPLGVMKANRVRFRPALGDTRQRAIEQIGFGQMAKVALAYDRPFWDNSVHYLGHLDETSSAWPFAVNLMPVAGKPALMLIATGQNASRVDRMPVVDLAGELQQAVSSMTGTAAPAPVAMVRSSWSTDPLALGCYSFPAPGSVPADFDLLGTPANNRLFFAGEHTAFDHYGTVHGAYFSGLRAARQVLSVSR